MTNAQSALAALALALRERLLGGGTAVLPGLGTLARVHVPARVETRPDGSRVLRPPGEAVRLTGAGGDPTPLAALLVRHLGTPQADPTLTLRQALDHLEARLSATGEARLPGLGTFERTSGGVRFLPGPDLMQSVNQPFAGLPPIRAATAADAPPARASDPPPAPAPPTAQADPPPAAPEWVSLAAGTSMVHGVPVLTVADAPPPGDAPVDPPPVDPPPVDPPPVDQVTDPSPLVAPATEALHPDPPAEHGAVPDESPPAEASPAAEAPAEASSPDEAPVWETPAWGTLDPLPAPTLSAAPDHRSTTIEDADFRVVHPDEAAPEAAPHDFAAVAPPETPPPAGLASVPAEAPPRPDDPSEAPVVPPADASRGGVLRLVGWFFVLSALSLFAVLWWHTQRGTSAPSEVTAIAPAPAAAPRPMPLDSAAGVPSVAPGDTMAAPMVFEAPGGVTGEPAPRPGADLPASDARALYGGEVERAQGGVTWVLHTARSAAAAEALAARYRAQGARVGVLGATRDGRPAWRVVVGQFESHEQALRLRDRLPPEAPSDTWPLRLR